MSTPRYFSPFPKENGQKLVQRISAERTPAALLDTFREMLLIRHFEVRGEAAYQQGHIGGFYHTYIGQEAIQTAVVDCFGQDHWYIGFYRCHALALLLGATPESVMAELYGKATGNAKGRGGSMHLYTEHMLGGFAIVGGHLPIATGAAFSLKYLGEKEKIAICFLGEGAVAQGAFHEALNLASLWDLPVLFIIENNQWGMGTHVSRALTISHHIAETYAPAYRMKGYTLDGMDYFSCYLGFQHIYQEMRETGRPVLVECVCERFRGHSISDPGLYRTKEEVKKVMERDPLLRMRHLLEEAGLLDEALFKQMDKEALDRVRAAMKYAEESPWPSPLSLEEEVYAP